ncbi:putative protein phosphatase CG10417 [Rhynchophorus ferrugineus]|uniref:protein-serine/threonine phosphatase n=1 Tax=Rhynchophorus ferrugineus TaxID=354439 RepID=A0A834IH18_RHYFE|nr:hypothetical protein GWI33_013414 [Rhynchophorus ferrugineus]
MGSYLSEPITKKNSVDEENDKLIYGASSMQGWRESQEDAHNSILDFDENTAYFAVYDGHGGHEVAQYCSEKLPDFIKNTDAYKGGNLEQALIDGFLGFDSTIATPEIISVLQDIAADHEADESEEENVSHLYAEAVMPIEKVIEKYKGLVKPTLKYLNKGEKLPRSPIITAKNSRNESASSSSNHAGEEACGSSKDLAQGPMGNMDIEVAECSTESDNENKDHSLGKLNGEDKNEENIKDPLDISTSQNGTIPQITNSDESNGKDHASNDDIEKNSDKSNLQNGELKKNDEIEKKDETAKEEEIATNKLKGKSILKKSPKKPNTRPKRNATQLYKTLLDYQGDSEEESDDDEEDKTFVGSAENSSDDEGVNASVEGEEESSEDGEEEEDEDDEGEDEEEDEDEGDLEFARNMKEEPGSSSGCTAVVALLKGTELFVANAGDSRCIICRNGQAVEMSFDHKPEDEPERSRIIKAGGKVTGDGRVNGGLNLSRAIGDHAYKLNKDLSDKEQMITALPDIKTLTINPTEDEFMVLACDGIWNFMTSQEVVDFVKPRLEANPEKLSHICEEMFDHCLAPNTMGDGTGCDNMTAIIVKFKPTLKKRQASPGPAEVDTDTKRAKTQDETAGSSS